MRDYFDEIKEIPSTKRITRLREDTLDAARYLSVEQAKLITRAWQAHSGEPVILKRAYAFRESAHYLEISIGSEELIVGNRSALPCAGIVFPESGVKWLIDEIDRLEDRPQDRFFVRPEDRGYFFEELIPFWKGMTLEEKIEESLNVQIACLEVVGKLNQKDHAQGHICPDSAKWLEQGPAALLAQAREKLADATGDQREYYMASCIVLEAACHFIGRYATLAQELSKTVEGGRAKELFDVGVCCDNLSRKPAGSFREAVQSLWFLFVLLQLESNASSFSPGRADQYLYPYFERDMKVGAISLEDAQELIDALFIKFNQIVYMRNTQSAAFFAGFPIGFNIAVGGKNIDGSDTSNALSYMMLRAQEHVRMRQPNLSARLHQASPNRFVRRVSEVIALGTGMPQVFSDDSVIPALEATGFTREDAVNYAVIGCVELGVHGKSLGFSDAAMFNIIKVLEVTMNDGVCMRTRRQLGLRLGTLTDFSTYDELELAFKKQLNFFIEQMEEGLRVVERFHRECLPSPFLSAVIDDCMQHGVDVTAGGARYNFSGVQLIQVANLADCLAALKSLVYDTRKVDASELLYNLRNNYPDEKLRLIMLNHAPKYGNDIAWVDELANKWVEYFKSRLDTYQNYRGGLYTVGLYTVSAHVPMGLEVAATPDGRKSGEPLADGGMSAVYGRDQHGPTALLNSVARIHSKYAANGTLLNMKFNPQVFATESGVNKFCGLLRGFVRMGIHHVQFNVVNRDDLLAAIQNPEKNRHLLVRVAGYTAHYVDLAETLQNEIIQRTEYGD